MDCNGRDLSGTIWIYKSIFSLRMAAERLLTEKQKKIYLCFIDYETAFDRVKHDFLYICKHRNRKKRIDTYKEPVSQQQATVKVGLNKLKCFP